MTDPRPSDSGVPLPARVLDSADPFCPKCGHNRDKSSVSSIDMGDARRSCQMCSTEWVERAALPVHSDERLTELIEHLNDEARKDRECGWPKKAAKKEEAAALLAAASEPTEARIRAEALEEAAKEAVRHTTHPDDPTNEVWQSAYNHVATEIAAAIRALVLPSTGEKT